MIEVVCYGGIMPDCVLGLPRFPTPGESVHVGDEQLYLGGEPSNVGGHLARWGVRVGLAGNNLGDDARAAFVEAAVAARPNTTLLVGRDAAMRTPTCYILTTPDGERTILAAWPSAASFSLPPRVVVEQARLVSVSIYGPGMDEMIALAQQCGTPLAQTDVSGDNLDRLRGAAIITTSQATLAQRYGISDIHGWINHVGAITGGLVVVTSGADAVLARAADGELLSCTPPTIAPRDTTGAGDAFKATVLYGWLNGWPLAHTLERAARLASAVCTLPGPCPDVPGASDEYRGMSTE